MTDEKAVLITTSHRGVFFGYTEKTIEDIVERRIVSLRAGRNVIYWPTGNKGFIGLAAMGPKDGSRIGPPADIAVNDITSAVYCTADSVAAFERAPWSR